MTAEPWFNCSKTEDISFDDFDGGGGAPPGGGGGGAPNFSMSGSGGGGGGAGDPLDACGAGGALEAWVACGFEETSLRASVTSMPSWLFQVTPRG